MNNDFSFAKNSKEINKLTREAIQGALIHLLVESPIDKISVTEIAARAGVSRSAYYKNYDTKEDVLVDFTNSLFKDILYSLDEEKYYNNHKQLFIDIFTRVYENSKLLYLLIKSNLKKHLNFLKLDKLFEYNIYELYQIKALETSLAAMVKEWIVDDFKISIEDMANISYNIFPQIDILFNKARQK